MALADALLSRTAATKDVANFMVAKDSEVMALVCQTGVAGICRVLYGCAVVVRMSKPRSV